MADDLATSTAPAIIDPPKRPMTLRMPDGQLHPQWQRFLDNLGMGYMPTRACELAQVAKSSAYMYRKEDAAFAEAWDEHFDSGTDRVIDEATRRAVQGVDVPQLYKGKVVTFKDTDGKEKPLMIKQFSDHVLIELMRARKPSMFRPKLEVTGKDGGALAIRIESLTTEQLINLVERIEQLERDGMAGA